MADVRVAMLLLGVLAVASACKGGSSAAATVRPEKTGAATSDGSPPGAPAFDDALARRLEKAWTGRSPQYTPRTRHLKPDGSPKYTNRLFLETSPYLLQHAHNPVNWYPWGDEAFETARKLKRPVLLSIGYSTCHWCHVMEEESFEDVEIARYMNENYIAIKVDREERPDVDAIYMQAVQMLTGRGGWPMTSWLEPVSRTPFYGAPLVGDAARRRLQARHAERGGDRGPCVPE